MEIWIGILCIDKHYTCICFFHTQFTTVHTYPDTTFYCVLDIQAHNTSCTKQLLQVKNKYVHRILCVYIHVYTCMYLRTNLDKIVNNDGTIAVNLSCLHPLCLFNNIRILLDMHTCTCTYVIVTWLSHSYMYMYLSPHCSLRAM